MTSNNNHKFYRKKIISTKLLTCQLKWQSPPESLKQACQHNPDQVVYKYIGKMEVVEAQLYGQLR